MSDDFRNNHEGSSYEDTDCGSFNFDIEEVSKIYVYFFMKNVFLLLFLFFSSTLNFIRYSYSHRSKVTDKKIITVNTATPITIIFMFLIISVAGRCRISDPSNC